MSRLEKIVFAGKPTRTIWNNTKIAHGPMAEEIIKLRRRNGKYILILGSGKLVSSCISMGLVDEYRLWIHPVFLGKGNALFKNLNKTITLKLSDASILEPGIAVLNYQTVT